MESLGSIIEAAKSGEKPNYDELRYAVCAMSSLMVFDLMALRALADAEKQNKKRILSYSAVFQYEERMKRVYQALNKSPLEWLGVENCPDSPEAQERRKGIKKLVSKIIENIA